MINPSLLFSLKDLAKSWPGLVYSFLIGLNNGNKIIQCLKFFLNKG